MNNTRLENWSFGSPDSNPYLAPEQISFRLAGKVYGHKNPRHTDGKEIVTSPIIGKRNGLVVTKSGTEYELLDPAAEYEAQYPNAKERLFKTLPEV